MPPGRRPSPFVPLLEDYNWPEADELAEGRLPIEWGGAPDVHRALELDRAYRDLSLGLVDGIVMAVAERLEARAIVTLDLGDFGAVTLKGQPEIWPRDL